MNLRTILFSQYPALFLLAVLFLIAHLRVRKTSAVKSVLWVILFGVALAASVVCCFLGIQAELWTLKTLITLGFWSWFGVGLVLLFLVLRVVHGMEKRSSRRRLDKAMKQAEKQKEEEVSRARAEGAAAERERAEAEAAARAEEAAREEAARAAAEAAAAPSTTDFANMSPLCRENITFCIYAARETSSKATFPATFKKNLNRIWAPLMRPPTSSFPARAATRFLKSSP